MKTVEKSGLPEQRTRKEQRGRDLFSAHIWQAHTRRRSYFAPVLSRLGLAEPWLTAGLELSLVHTLLYLVLTTAVKQRRMS